MLHIVPCYDFYAANDRDDLQWVHVHGLDWVKKKRGKNGNLTLKTIPGAAATGPCLWNFLRAGRTVSCMGQH